MGSIGVQLERGGDGGQAQGLGHDDAVTSRGEPITVEANFVNDCKKAKAVLGATSRPVEDTIRAVVESSVELGIITPKVSPP